VQEIERVSKLSGIRGVYLPTSLPTREAVGSIAPAGVRALRGIEYAGAAARPSRLSRPSVYRLFICEPARQSVRHGVAAAYLYFGGVLDRYPRLDAFCRTRARVPYLFGRLEPWTRGAAGSQTAKAPFREYVHRSTTTRLPLAELLKFLVDPGRCRCAVMLGTTIAF